MPSSRIHNVLITDRFETEAFALLQASPNLKVERSTTHEPTASELENCEALIIRSRTKITSGLLERAPRLRVIVTATSGFDHIDFAATEARGLVVMHTPEANVQSATELTWTLILACARRVVEAHRAVKAGNWSREALTGTELQGKTYGVVGLGRIGGRVAALARAFGMRVVAFDPYRDEDHFALHNAVRLGLEELVRSVDFMSIHVPATSETKHMLHGGHFANTQPHLILVNTSRGHAINEEDLHAALLNGRIRAAGLDVYEKEPLNRNSPLLQLSNVVLSPHLGATTGEAFAKASRDAGEKVRRFFAGNEVTDPLPPRDLWYKEPFRHL
jgi:D-3-phosphoglycerate dehydrogenase